MSAAAERRLGIVRVSIQLLELWLAGHQRSPRWTTAPADLTVAELMPPDTTDAQTRSIRVIVASARLEPVPEGGTIPEIMPPWYSLSDAEPDPIPGLAWRRVGDVH